jgi:hypothetical protein
LETELEEQLVPAYDLGYLLRKLEGHYPQVVRSFDPKRVAWSASVEVEHGGAPVLRLESEPTPEDALCRLAIEVFKRGVLKKDGDE